MKPNKEKKQEIAISCEQEIADQEADKVLTTEVFPKYLFRKGEKWTHVDKFGNMWFEDIKTK